MVRISSSYIQLKRVILELLRERRSPARLAWAVGVGVFVGLLPLYGLHLVICVAAATLLKLNRVVTCLASNVSNPLFFPVLAFVGVQIGHLMLYRAWVPMSFEAFKKVDLLEFGIAWAVGSLALGVVLGALVGAATYVGARRYRGARPQVG